ncbi:MAG: hypothetical protein KC586_29235 [Myxococcales bacterium]|nr:hypothetical protein [Myxococcales bacterium]
MSRWAWLVCVLLGCNPCRRDDVLVEDGDARLVWIRGTGGGVAVGAPHAPVAIPYVRRFSNVRFVDATHETMVLDLEPDSVRGATFRVDPTGARFALGTDEGWRVFYLTESYARPDPELVPDEPVWDEVPTLAERVVEIYATTSDPGTMLWGGDLPPEILARVVRELFDRAPGERMPNAQEWAERGVDRWHAALERVPEDERAPLLEPLHEAYRDPEASGLVLRRARWTLPFEALAVPEAVAARRVRDTGLDDAERATALVLVPERSRAPLACEVLGTDVGPLLGAYAARHTPVECLGAFVDAHRCESPLECATAGEGRALVPPGPNLRDTHPDAVALAHRRLCEAGVALPSALSARRARLGYRFDVQTGQPRDLLRRAACESDEPHFEREGVPFEVDDVARVIRQVPATTP